MPLDNCTVDQFRPSPPVWHFPAALNETTQNETI